MAKDRFAPFIDHYIEGEDKARWALDLPLALHELYHLNSFETNAGRTDSSFYFLTPDHTIAVSRFPTFHTREMVTAVPSHPVDQLLRFDTYVDVDSLSAMYSNTNGIFGLMEEYCAYYFELKASVALHDYLLKKHGYDDPEVWVDYYGTIASTRYAMLEFKLFISWYLQFAQSCHPTVYQACIESDGLRNLFTFLDEELIRLTNSYDQQRATLFTKMGDSLHMDGDFLTNSESGHAMGVQDEEYGVVAELLEAPEHLILEKLRVAP